LIQSEEGGKGRNGGRGQPESAPADTSRLFGRGEENWPRPLKEKMTALDWKAVKNNVLHFFESQDDLLSFTRENLLVLLDG